MVTDAIIHGIDVWVSQYLAIFCLFTVVAWGGGSYLFLVRWTKPVRDSITYFIIIATLALALALQHSKQDVLFWSSLSWFCFSMLLMFELLWLAYLTEGLLRKLTSLSGRFFQSARPTHNHAPLAAC